MSQYLVIDHEEKSSELIKATIKSLDEKAIFVSSTSLAQFRKDTAQATEPMPFDVVVLDYFEFSPASWHKEIEALKKQLAPNTNMKIIMVGYEDPAIDRKKLTKLDIFNFIFKPFDALILKETFNSAALANKRQTSVEIKSQKSSAIVGVLKDIEMQSISELGFVTLSEEQIPPQSIAKYFSGIFTRGVKQSVWAQCLRSIPHPNKEKTFINQFQFLAIDQSFCALMRKFTKDHKLDATSNALWAPVAPPAVVKIKIALIGHDDSVSQKLRSDLVNHFTNCECDIYPLNQKPADQIQLPHQIIINLSEVGPESILTHFTSQAKLFLVREPFVNEDDLKECCVSYADIFINPLERTYLYNKLKFHMPALAEKEERKFLNVVCHDKMKVANLLQISDISEVYVSFNYHRELPSRSWREFTLISEDERNMIELQAFCNFSEKSQNEKDMFFHQFVFFGMTDHYLKSIRLWLVQSYVAQKKSS